jgi:DNA-binding transcriptional MerR regulator
MYSFQDLVQLRVIKKLLDAGVSLQRIRKAVDFLQENMNKQPQGITLMSDGSSIYACESEDEIIDLVKRGQGVFAIALDKVWDDLSGSLARSRREARTAVAEAGGA